MTVTFPESLPFLRAEGSPHEVGRRHGEAFTPQVHGSIALYRELFARDIDLPWEEALVIAERAGENIRALDGALADELAGIAAGADVDPREVLAINVRTSILQTARMRRDQAPDPECTTSASLPSATADGHTLMAGNWDQRLECMPNTVVIEQRTGDDPALLYFTEAGILFRSGMNDAGIGVLGNGLQSDLELGGDRGVPAPIQRRRALRQRTLAAAVDEIRSAPKSHSVNHLLAGAEGAAVDLETVPGHTFAIEPEDGVLVHANHFLNPDAADVLEDRALKGLRCSLYRTDSLRDEIVARRGRIDVAGLQAALSDHYGYPKSVCRHPVDDAGRGAVTLVSGVWDLTAGTAWLTPGTPCTGTATEYAFSEPPRN